MIVNCRVSLISHCSAYVLLCETDRRKADRVDLNDVKSEWEMKTITSAVKNYFRYPFHRSQYTFYLSVF